MSKLKKKISVSGGRAGFYLLFNAQRKQKRKIELRLARDATTGRPACANKNNNCY